jgi:RNA polymerase sigma-70 factor (ECF subfamily)
LSGVEVAIPTRQAPSDKEARFADLYRRYGQQIRAYCIRRTASSDVADAVADTFLVAWRRIERIPEGDAILPWLYGVAYRVLSHQWRHEARGRRLIEKLQGMAPTEPLSVEVLVVGNEKYRLVLQASSRLRPIDREVLRLTLWEEMSHADVAAVLGIGLAAVKQRAYRARRNLAAEYERLANQPQPPAAWKGGGL